MIAMAEGRQDEAWNHTSQLLAMLVNVNRDPKSDPVQPRDFHPFRAGNEIPHEADVSALKAIFKL